MAMTTAVLHDIQRIIHITQRGALASKAPLAPVTCLFGMSPAMANQNYFPQEVPSELHPWLMPPPLNFP